MTKTIFNALKKKLPYQYASLIAQKLDGVSNVQVMLVFRGVITNPEKVEKVVRAARDLVEKLQYNKDMATIGTRKKKRSRTKPTV